MPMRRGMLAALVCLSLLLPAAVRAESWPMYGHDNARSGVTAESLTVPLNEQWVYKGRGPVVTAWPDPQPVALEGQLETPRVRFDDAYHVAVADGAVYFGTSSDNKVYCLDAATVLVDGDMAFCTAGVFPGERVYLYGLRAEDGTQAWINDTLSDGSAGQNGFSPQGYLLASGSTLFVPSGRSLPAAFDKATGRFLFQRSYSRFSPTGALGGTYALLVEGHLYSGAGAIADYDAKNGNLGFAIYPGKRLIVTPETSYMLDKDGLSALDRRTYPELNKKLRDLAGQRTALQTAKPADLEDQLKQLDAGTRCWPAARARLSRWTRRRATSLGGARCRAVRTAWRWPTGGCSLARTRERFTASRRERRLRRWRRPCARGTRRTTWPPSMTPRLSRSWRAAAWIGASPWCSAVRRVGWRWPSP
jgi:outer membrane protein assembly factor BamB